MQKYKKTEYHSIDKPLSEFKFIEEPYNFSQEFVIQRQVEQNCTQEYQYYIEDKRISLNSEDVFCRCIKMSPETKRTTLVRIKINRIGILDNGVFIKEDLIAFIVFCHDLFKLKIIVFILKLIQSDAV